MSGDDGMLVDHQRIIDALLPTSVRHKETAAVSFAAALLGLSALATGDVVDLLVELDLSLSPAKLIAPGFESRREDLAFELARIIEFTDEEPEDDSFYPFGVMVALFYALNVGGSGSPEQQLGWSLARCEEITDLFDSEYPGRHLGAALDQGLDRLVPILCRSSDLDLDVTTKAWACFDDLRSALSGLSRF